MIDTLRNRRSIRDYSNKEISEQMLNELLEAATRASNTGNMQLYSVVVTRDQQKKEALAPTHFNQSMVTQAPIVLTFCADTNRFVKWSEQRNADAGFDNFQTFVAAMIDTMLFAESFCDLAEEKGLGLCYLGTTTYNAAQIIDILELPHRVVPITTVTLGYPAFVPEQPERLPLEAIIHSETYTDYTPERIDSLYKEKEELEVNKQYVLENKKENLAQVFTDIRYTRKNNEYFSEQFIQVLKQQGFM